MQIEITKDVASHHTNPIYPVLRVRWSKADKNFQTDEIGPNWTPRDQELLDININMILLSPTFEGKLQSIVNALKRR